jgi:hypothetical protein
MSSFRLRASRSALALAALITPAAFLAACGPGTPAGDDTSESDPSDATNGQTDSMSSNGTVDTADTEAPVGWFQVGWGQGEFVPLADGDAFPIVLGGQGAQMWPVPLQGGEWFLPGNPTSWMDETGPFVDFEMDIEGYNDGPGGHFKRIANYTLDWIVLPDGTYQSSFLPVIVPDGIDPEELDGKPAHVWVRLRPFEQPSLEIDLDVVVTVEGELPG